MELGFTGGAKNVETSSLKSTSNIRISARNKQGFFRKCRRNLKLFLRIGGKSIKDETAGGLGMYKGLHTLMLRLSSW